MATFSDDFNRANGAIGANYDSVNGGLNVISNQVRGTNNGQLNLSTVKTSVVDFTNDHEAQITIAAAVGSDLAGPMVRSAGTTANGYYLYCDIFAATNRRLFKVVAGTRTIIGTVNISVTAGDVLKLRAVGTTLTVYKNGTLIDTVLNQTDHTTGQPGMAYEWGNSGGTRIDNFSAADVSTATPIAVISSVHHLQGLR
jgi:hypothetical protein